MAKNGSHQPVSDAHRIKRVLITQPRPDSDKSPYFELARKYSVEMDFHPFIRLEPIPSKDFRRQKIDIAEYSAVVFTSRNAIEHFFRICEEMKVPVSQETKYFCISEAVALYLQKYILYRKRKVFFGADGTTKSLFDVICFFTPSGVKSLLDNIPAYKQNGTYIGAFGSNTSKAILDAGLNLHIKAPEPEVPSMVAALERFLRDLHKS